MPVFGLNNAMVPIGPTTYGARRRGRIAKTVRPEHTVRDLMSSSDWAVHGDPRGDAQKVQRLGHHADHRRTGPAHPAIAFLFAGFCIISGSVFQALETGATR